MENYKTLLLVSAISALTACSGGSSSSDSVTGPDPIKSTGVFLDSPVAKIGYRTETLEGITNSLGEYEYVEGEKVTFFIGDLVFPPVTASGVVTPADIASEDNILQTNILQILQTLDYDKNPTNGITIHDDAAEVFIGKKFELSNAGFDSEIAVTLATIDDGLTLVEESAANAHFETTLQSQILGSWKYSEGAGKTNVLTFIEGNKYIIIHQHDDEPGVVGSQTAGSVEYGSYTWDVNDGGFTTTLIGESDGWGGLYDGSSSFNYAAVENNSLVLRKDSEGATFTRIVSDSNPLIGGWINADNVLVFLSESEYSIAHWANPEGQTLSGEFGTYQLNGDDFKALSASVDTDGEGGLYNAGDASDQEGETLTIDQSTISFSDQDEGLFDFKRVGIF
ncbi:adhesin [Pelagibaculum spongiae]|uniref:Adhesin n=1 Tax=Pelagibaculum spongiae TaxID=2080658 RepID=A0A2V1GR02_9GAMM|nr:adhesin [Pelagibaculum spongiae]PVZ66652.1 adhesin [Pelagibaculum spongiae]